MNSHKGMITFDVLFAVIVIIFIFFFSFLILSEIQKSIEFEQRRALGNTKVFLLSSKLVKRDLAHSDGENSYTNVISSNVDVKLEEYLSDFNASAVSIKIDLNIFSIGNFSETEKFCMQRVVYILDKQEVGFLGVCLQ